MNANKRELKDKESASIIGVHSRPFADKPLFDRIVTILQEERGCNE